MPIELDDAAQRRRCVTALAGHPSTGPFAAFAVGPADPLADVARTVLAEAGGYVAYEEVSLLLLVVDRGTNLPAAAGRVVNGGGRALDDAPDRIHRDLSDIALAHGLHDGKIWELATLTVRSAYRDRRSAPAVSSLLYRTLLRAGRRAGVQHLVGLLDDRTHSDARLLGIPFVPMAGSSPAARAVHARFDALEPAIADQADRLRRPGSSHAGTIGAWSLRGLFTRRTAARVAAAVASGEGLDEHIALPGVERRRFAHRRR